MSIDGINAQFQAGMAQTPVNAQAAVAQNSSGVFMGHAVQVAESPESLLADSAEELGFAVDKTKDKAVEERKQRETSEIGKRLMELYQILMQKVGKADQMNQLVEQLKKSSNKSEMERLVKDAFPDVADGWAALGKAIEDLENDPSVSVEQKSHLKELKDDYEKNYGKDIKLGVHGALAGQDFPELGGMDSTRDLYRKTVGEFSSVNEVFKDIKTKFAGNFDKAMDFLFSAISSDIDSEVPSMGKAHLESVHAKLGLVRLTQSAYGHCEDLLARWHDEHGVAVCMLKPMDLLESILALRNAPFVGSNSINQICAKANAPDIEHEVLFVQDLMNTLRKFPDNLFDDARGRMNLMNAVQTAIDEAIAREDEFLAQFE